MGNTIDGKTYTPYPEPILRALRKLILCNRLREYANCSRPVLLADLRWKEYIFIGLANCARYTRTSEKLLVRQVVAPFLVEPFILIALRLLLYRKETSTTIKQIAKSIRDTVKAILHRIYYYDSISSAHTCFRDAINDKGNLERNNCLLLYAMGRYGEAVQQLSNAFLAGRDSLQTTRWLSYFLTEIGDIRTAEDIIRLNSIPLEDPNREMVSRSIEEPRQILDKGNSHKYGIVIPCMADSPVFRNSLISLLESDFQGKIVVVEDGLRSNRACEKFCMALSIDYLKLESHGGPSECFNVGIRRLGNQIDLIVLGHNDVLWPQRWFSKLSSVWDDIYDHKKVGIINLGYLQFNSNETLKELFVRRSYEDLGWILKRLMKVSYLTNLVQDVQVNDVRETFGLAYDPWNTEFDKCKVMAGRWSVAVSFPREIWAKMGGFSPNVFLADLEMQRYCMQHKKLMLWINNTHLIHCRSSDTNDLKGGEFAKFKEMEAETYKYFSKKYGFEIDHFLSALFADTYVTYSDEIIKAANESRFLDADFIFDYFDKRLSVLPGSQPERGQAPPPKAGDARSATTSGVRPVPMRSEGAPEIRTVC